MSKSVNTFLQSCLWKQVETLQNQGAGSLQKVGAGIAAGLLALPAAVANCADGYLSAPLTIHEGDEKLMKLPSGENVQVATINTGMFPGPIPKLIDNLAPWHERIDALVELIRKIDPHVCILQEVFSIEAASALAEKLSDRFWSIYNVAPNPFGLNSGLHLLYRIKILLPRAINLSQCPGSQSGINRAALVFDIALGNKNTPIRTVGLHLEPGEDKAEVRKAQLDRVLEAGPSIVAGDFNFEGEAEEFNVGGLKHNYEGPPTHPETEQTNDFIYTTPERLLETTPIDTGDVSDHLGLIAEIKIL